MTENTRQATQIAEQAWSEYENRLLAFIRGKVRNEDDAKDILNSTFMKLLQFTTNHQPPRQLASWLYQVTRNGIVDYYRGFKGGHESFDDTTVQAQEEPSPDAIQQLSECIRPMVEALPENYRQVLISTELENQTHQAVAQTLGLSLSAIKSRVLRGREKLRQSILRCCSIQQNRAGQITDYQHKNQQDCCQTKNPC